MLSQTNTISYELLIQATWTDICQIMLLAEKLPEDIDFIRDSLSTGNCLLAVARGEAGIEGFLLGRPTMKEGLRTVIIESCVLNSLRDALPLWEQFESQCQQKKVEKLVFLGRRGWERQLAPLGFKLTKVYMEKNLSSPHFC